MKNWLLILALLLFLPLTARAQDAAPWEVVVYADGASALQVLSAQGVSLTIPAGSLPLRVGAFPSAPLVALSAPTPLKTGHRAERLPVESRIEDTGHGLGRLVFEKRPHLALRSLSPELPNLREEPVYEREDGKVEIRVLLLGRAPADLVEAVPDPLSQLLRAAGLVALRGHFRRAPLQALAAALRDPGRNRGGAVV